MGIYSCIKNLHSWFLENRRDFPWRKDPTPYKVWISEIMLQQTRAKVVVDYFEKWLKIFPDIQTLAQAQLLEVIKAWEGLGYYSRARNIHSTAKQIVEEFDCVIPQDEKKLNSLKGLGPYTVGAILSFGFNKRAAAVDANVIRVMSRFLQIEENIKTIKVRKRIETEVEALLDFEKPWVTMEALIELGSEICTPRPKCTICPMQPECKAFKTHKTSCLPIKSEPKKIQTLKRIVFLIETQTHILLKKPSEKKVMRDLFEFPYFEVDVPIFDIKKLQTIIYSQWNLDVEYRQKYDVISHTFTRYKAMLYPFKFFTKQTIEYENFIWFEKSSISSLPFSSGHRRLLDL